MKKMFATMILLFVLSSANANEPPASYQKLKHEFKTMKLDYTKTPRFTRKEKAIFGASIGAGIFIVNEIWIRTENPVFHKTLPFIMVGYATIQLILMQ
jgi:hypothetical protein